MGAPARSAQFAAIVVVTFCTLTGCGSSGEGGDHSSAAEISDQSQPHRSVTERTPTRDKPHPAVQRPGLESHPASPSPEDRFLNRLAVIANAVQRSRANAGVLAAIRTPGVASYPRTAGYLSGYLPRLDAYIRQTEGLNPPPRCRPVRSTMIRMETGTRRMFVRAIPLLRDKRRTQLSGVVLAGDVIITGSLQHLRAKLGADRSPRHPC
jgi:hypothetical protein